MIALQRSPVMPAPHPPEFRQRAVDLAKLGEADLGDRERHRAQRGQVLFNVATPTEFGRQQGGEEVSWCLVVLDVSRAVVEFVLDGEQVGSIVPPMHAVRL